MKLETLVDTEVRNEREITYLGQAAGALTHLLHSYEYARDVGCDAWEFALEIHCLRRDGLREADLRWMMMNGLIKQGYERTRLADRTRRFLPLKGMKFSKRSSFLLTEQGAKMVKWLLKMAPSAATASKPAGNLHHGHEGNGFLEPIWDRDRRELWWSNQVVKQFKVAAPNQETILAAFQEEHWPRRIDDPLPPIADIESRRRLHDTIVSLNRNRKAKLVRFLGDGSGEGVRWELEVRPNGRSFVRCAL